MNTVTAQTRKYFYAMVVLLALFMLRVAGQFSVAVFHPPALPPMHYWQSGLLPYPFLLLSQIIIIVLLSKVCIDFKRGKGIFATPNKKLGRFLITFGSLYLSVTLIRFIFQGLSIPVVFHWILAIFLLIWGRLHNK